MPLVAPSLPSSLIRPIPASHRRWRRAVRAPTLAMACALIGALGGCRDAVLAWGPSLDRAKRHADNALAGFAFRFHNVQRSPKFEAARPKMARSALIPSRIFNDTSIWTVTEADDSSRALYLNGSFTHNRYLFTTRASGGPPEKVGDQRHFMRLRSLGDGSYEWFTVVDHGLGPIGAAQTARAIGALFTSFAGKQDTEILADSRETFPRTGRHLGQLLRIDSLRSRPSADGTTSMAMYIAITPDGVRARYPAFAAYLDKYLMPTVTRVQLTDGQGAQYFDLNLRDGGFVVRLRARDESLVALTGTPHALPESLQIRMDVSAKFKIFRVGFTNMVGDFVIERGEHEHAWTMRFRKEPSWHFPFAVDKLIKSPLRRPFEGRGSELRLAVRDDPGSQTMSTRQVRTVVRESAIMRWLGGLGATAFGEFSGRSEIEENRFLAELFGALRQDFAAVSR